MRHFVPPPRALPSSAPAAAALAPRLALRAGAALAEREVLHSLPSGAVASGSALARHRRTLAAPWRARPPRADRRCRRRRSPACQSHTEHVDILAAARPEARLRRAPVRSVAAGDVRRDTLPARHAASAEAPSVTPPDTRHDDSDRSSVLTMIVCPIRSRRTPSCALRDRPANCRRNSGMPRSTGWALTPFLTPLKSRLYGGAALTFTPDAAGFRTGKTSRSGEKRIEIRSRIAQKLQKTCPRRAGKVIPSWYPLVLTADSHDMPMRWTSGRLPAPALRSRIEFAIFRSATTLVSQPVAYFGRSRNIRSVENGY